MSQVIPLFIEDEMTGHMIPNLSSPEEYILCSEAGGHRITFQRSQAIGWLAEAGEGYWIETMPATKRATYKVE